METIFNSVQVKAPGSSTFNLSHDVKTSLDMGFLVPSLTLEVLPGDNIKISSETMMRFQPLIAPVMHRVKVKTNFFFVPNRLLWDGWEDFITGNLRAGATEEAPYITNTPSNSSGDVADYMGIPTTVGDPLIRINALPFAAYAKIWDDWFRDQNLQEEVFTPLTFGENAQYEQLAFSAPLRRAWEHDYFTSSLPFAQKGDVVTLPLTNEDTLPVNLKIDYPDGFQVLRRSDSGDLSPSQSVRSSAANQLTPGSVLSFGSGQGALLDPNGTMEVDLNNEAVEITTLRRAIILQEFLEKAARGGTRYIESMKMYFNVTSSDARLQRAEYVGGAVQNMAISEVLATAETPAPEGGTIVPIGQMAGHGISAGSTPSFSYKAEEHGFFIGIVSVVPDTAYQQGIHKMWNRENRLDYAFPDFANIGEQEVLNKELFAELSNSNIYNGVFGYMPRYANYKFLNSRVSGDMRGNLAYWHLGRIFNLPPALNEDFIECNPSKRIFAVVDPDVHSIVSHIYHNISVNRKLPKHGNPHI